MKLKTLKEAVSEAKRFIKAAEQCNFEQSTFNPKIFYPICTKSTAATKRASMDLTRKLADLRLDR